MFPQTRKSKQAKRRPREVQRPRCLGTVAAAPGDWRREGYVRGSDYTHLLPWALREGWPFSWSMEGTLPCGFRLLPGSTVACVGGGGPEGAPPPLPSHGAPPCVPQLAPSPPPCGHRAPGLSDRPLGAWEPHWAAPLPPTPHLQARAPQSLRVPLAGEDEDRQEGDSEAEAFSLPEAGL